MNLQKAIDFETFYFISLLDEIKRQGRDDLDPSVHEIFEDFIGILSTEENPIRNIEKLAPIPATSDISIFFSDLLERIKQFSPEKAVERISEYASDFLAIFRELARDPQWYQNIQSELSEKTPPEEEKLSFHEFITSQIRTQLESHFQDKYPAGQSSINNLIERIEHSDSLSSMTAKYENVEELDTTVDRFKKVYELQMQQPSPAQPPMIQLQTRITAFAEELSSLYTENPQIFEMFCKGDEILVPITEPSSEPELEKVTRSTEQPEDIKQTDMTEDQNLKWLLRDYLIHEIEELTNEVTQQISKISEAAADNENESIILDNLKVLKDLGQIHKYPLIEQVSGELQQSLKETFKKQATFPPTAIDPIHNLLHDFSKYIDAVLEGNEQEIARSIKDKKEIINGILISDQPEETVFPEVSFSMKDRDKIEPVFVEVQNRFVVQSEKNYRSLLQDPDNDEIRNILVHNLQHLKSWYLLLKLPGAPEIMDILTNWASNPNQQEKLFNKQNKILNSFQALAKSLFTTSADQWTQYIEDLVLSEPAKNAVDVSQAASAFREVTRRQLELLRQKFGESQQSLQELIRSEAVPQLHHISKNSEIARQENVRQWADYVAGRIEKLVSESREEDTLIRSKLENYIAQVIEYIPDSKASFPHQDLQARLDSLLITIPSPEKDTKEPGDEKEEISENREPDSEELSQTFQEEAGKHLENMEIYLKKLSQHLNDKTALSQLNSEIHAFNNAAQVMKMEELKVVLDAFETLCDNLLKKKIELKKQFVSLSRKIVKNLRKFLENKKVNSEKILDSLEGYQSKNQIEKESVSEAKKKSEGIDTTYAEEVEEPSSDIKEETGPSVQDEKSQESETSRQKTPAEDIPVLQLKERDPELLEIFRNEAMGNLDSIEKDITLIEKFRHDKQTLQSLDHSVHEIRSAAKMLGFSEIGNLADGFEELIESLTDKDPDEVRAMIPAFRKVIRVIRELTEKQEIQQELYKEAEDSISNLLSDSKEKQESTPETDTGAAGAEDGEIKDLGIPIDAMVQTFIQEARDYLDELNFILMKMEKSPDDVGFLYRLMRTFHTLKGSASMVSEENLEKLAHLCEEVIEKYRQKERSFPPELFDLLFEVIDEIDFVVSSLANGEKGVARKSPDLIKQLEAALSKAIPGPKKEKSTVESKETEKSETDQYLTVTDKDKQETDKADDTHVRLRVDQIDNLLNEAAELVINHNQFKTQIDKFKGYLPRMDMEGKNLQHVIWHLDKVLKEQQQIVDVVSSQFKDIPAFGESYKNQIGSVQAAAENLQKFYQNFNQNLQGLKESGKIYEEKIQKMTRLSTQIHDEIIQARLVPIEILFHRFHRPLRDLAKKNGKKIKLFLKGEKSELDRILAEKLYQPMLHILRNAVDHGIETPAVRKKQGKPEEGLIKVSAHQERNFISISIEDDGQGIDIEKIKKRAVELDYIDQNNVENLTEQEIFEFLLYSGFSTSREVTSLSGRGFGLDVVRNQIQKLKGDLRIYSTAGEGTRFVIRMPISLTVTQAILFEVDKNIYAIPLPQVEETTNIQLPELKLKDQFYHFSHRGREIPVINVSKLLKVPDNGRESSMEAVEYPLIITQDEGKRIGLLVNKILQREEILIKSLGKGLERVRFILGGSILADGRVILVLDIPQIVFYSARLKEPTLSFDLPELKAQRSEAEDSVPEIEHEKVPFKKKIIEGRKPKILVVDDSLSVRKFLSGLLSKNKYDVELAKNGNQAVEKLNQNEFDLLITDLEMPQLSGYELIEQIRADSRWDEMPILVLTGRASRNIEDQSFKLGANAYIIKPFKETDLLEKIGNFIEVK